MGLFGSKAKNDYSKRDNKEMHSTTCSSCNNSCQVPFKPTGSKPVYCSDCFEKNGSRRDNNRNDRGSFGNRRDSSNRRDFRSNEMFSTTCSSCNDSCQVPFKPNGSKPVYCSDCFEKNGYGGKENQDGKGRFRGGTRKFEQNGPNVKKELDKINEKLDMLMELMTEEYEEA